MIVLLLAAAVVVHWAVPWAAGRVGVTFARRRGWTVRNYRGVEVPVGLGAAWLAWAAVGGASAIGTGIAPALLVAGAAVLGWIDDRFGGDGPKGFRGHLSALAHGQVTTGLLKLAGVGVLALLAAWTIPAEGTAQPRRLAVWLLSAAVVALATNLVNLLDLRPGRALKAYVVLAAPSAAGLALAAGGVAAGARLSPAESAAAALTALVVLGPALACLPADLKERAMLGDTGANAAGAAAGFLVARAAASYSLPLLGLAAAVLLALNLASERVSFSAVIEGNAVLRWLDGLGRDAGGAGPGQRTADRDTGT